MSTAIPTEATQPNAVAGIPVYETIAALRQAHLALRRAGTRATDSRTPRSVAEQIRTFLSAARRTGFYLSDRQERKAAQTILDYWSAELAALPEPKPDDFKPVLLEPFDSAYPHQGGDSLSQDESEQRDLIRLAATARLWRDSGLEGFLLSGDALDHAAEFQGQDDNIGKLVQASRDALRKIRIAKIRWAVGGITAVILFVFALVPYLSNRAIDSFKNDADSNALQWLALYQPLRPPFDLSGNLVVHEGQRARGLKLKAPNFSVARFKSVDFQDADLQLASFSDTRITGTSNFGTSKFIGAKLYRAQFLQANIEATSFAGAELYRAIFDRACLTEVDFTGADLRFASFFGATFDDGFARKFKNSPWWLAEGWNWEQIDKLSTVGHDSSLDDLWKQIDKPSTVEQDSSLKVLVDDLKRVRAKVRAAAPGSTPRADSDNELAWTLATWGMVPIASEVSPPFSQVQTCSRLEDVAIPESAADAAEQAVCILQKLRNSHSGKDPTADFVNTQETRAYVLLQSGRRSEAAKIYRDEVTPFIDLKELRPSLDVGGTLFRAAVAHQAIGDSEAAFEFLNRSGSEQYVPTHEMRTLSRYIVGDFREAVRKQVKRWRPSIPPSARCREKEG